MITNPFANEIAKQHIEDLHREADARRLARLARVSTARTKRARKVRNNRSWATLQTWHVASSY
jgi:hypothetical protein